MVDAIIDGLGPDRVHVDPAVPGAASTAQGLGSHLREGDSVYLVVLPADPSGSSDPTQVAAQVGSRIDGDEIVVVAVGRDLGVSATGLPNGAAQDLLSRAEDVSNTPTDAMQTFTNLVHQRYPVTAESQSLDGSPAGPGDGKGFLSGGGFLALFVVLALFAAASWMFLRKPHGKARDAVTLVGPVDVPVYNLDRKYSSTELAEAMREWPTAERVGLPHEAGRHLAQVRDDLSDVLAKWDALTDSPKVAFDVSRIILSYVPELLSTYSRIPADMRGTSRGSSAPPDMQVTHMLRLLDEHLDEVRVAAHKGTLNALTTQKFFLDQRFTISGLDDA